MKKSIILKLIAAVSFTALLDSCNNQYICPVYMQKPTHKIQPPDSDDNQDVICKRPGTLTQTERILL